MKLPHALRFCPHSKLPRHSLSITTRNKTKSAPLLTDAPAAPPIFFCPAVCNAGTNTQLPTLQYTKEVQCATTTTTLLRAAGASTFSCRSQHLRCVELNRKAQHTTPQRSSAITTPHLRAAGSAHPAVRHISACAAQNLSTTAQQHQSCRPLLAVVNFDVDDDDLASPGFCSWACYACAGL